MPLPSFSILPKPAQNIFFLRRRAREDLRTANLRINTMLADYGDVVPRRDFEVLEASCKVWGGGGGWVSCACMLVYVCVHVCTWEECMLFCVQSLEAELEAQRTDHFTLIQEHE